MATPTAQTITITPSTTTYPIGAVVQIATLFATDGVAVDPSAVFFTYKPVALGTATTLTYGTDAALVKDSTGNYHVNLDTSLYGGSWNWRFFSTGTGQSSAESSFYVRPNAAVTSTVTPDINAVGATWGSSLIGFIQDGVGAAARWVQDKLRERVSVKDFGAVGNGVADDSLAIKAAVASLGTGGGVIDFPAGIYLVSDDGSGCGITIQKQGVFLKGVGCGDYSNANTGYVTEIKSVSNKPIVKLTTNGAGDTSVQGISGMLIRGSGAGSSQLGLNLDARIMHINDVKVANCGGVGVSVTDCIGSRIYGLRVDSCVSHGIVWDGTITKGGTSQEVSTSYYDYLEVQNCGGDGLRIVNGWANKVASMFNQNNGVLAGVANGYSINVFATARNTQWNTILDIWEDPISVANSGALKIHVPGGGLQLSANEFEFSRFSNGVPVDDTSPTLNIISGTSSSTDTVRTKRFIKAVFGPTSAVQECASGVDLMANNAAEFKKLMVGGSGAPTGSREMEISAAVSTLRMTDKTASGHVYDTQSGGNGVGTFTLYNITKSRFSWQAFHGADPKNDSFTILPGGGTILAGSNVASVGGTCVDALSGAVTIAAGATTVTVATTAVNANSQIIVCRDDSLGTRLSVTANTQSSLVLGTPRVTARTPATSFVISIDVGPTTYPMCISFFIIN